MPKAQATFDEDEKTTIESGWEDEASTTVEQGEVAEKLRAIEGLKTPLHGGGHVNGTPRTNTGITSTNGGALDEPTVDDQRANAALSLITPSVAPARIVVIAGNDQGQELEIRPGKTYTIGRAIDNDFVLTDIAVSRKHFDLLHENGTWLIADRKSGNGTVVNGNIEDQPFVLMNGDTIEIGNTQFRFDHANQPARARNSAFTLDVDEEEASTVAGKPMRDDIPSTPPSQGLVIPAPIGRPKTVPPPPRTRPPSAAPLPQPNGYLGFNGARAPLPAPAMPLPGGPIGVPMASPTAPTVSPMAQMPALPGLPGMRPAASQPPAILGENGVVRPQMLHGAHENLSPLANVMPTTIPGQGPPVAPSQPQVQSMPYGYPNVGDMKPQLASLQITGAPRDATSTSLVQPTPYGSVPPQPMAYGVAQPQPRMPRKVKIAIAGAALMVLAAIATIAIIKGGGDDKPKPKAGTTQPGASDAIAKALEKQSDDAKQGDTANAADDAKQAEDKKAEDAAKQADDKKAEDKKAEDKKAQKADEARKAEESRKAELERKQAQEEARRAEAERKKAEAEERRRAAAERKQNERNDRTSGRTNRTTTRVATAPSADISDVKQKAESLYRARKFSEAAAVLRRAAASLGEAEARQLRSTAGAYEQVGKFYNIGMGPATPAVEAYRNLEKALNLDRTIGVFTDEIRAKLGGVAPKAALKFMVDKNYPAAFKAVRVAEINGGKGSTTESVRDGLKTVANELYREAMAEKSSNPNAARAKLQRIKSMTDNTAVLAKAQKALRELK